MKVIQLIEAVLHQVESSNIDSIGFEDNTLEVKFKSGATYEYLGVPEEVYVEMMNAESKGRYLAQNIKGNYIYNRIS